MWKTSSEHEKKPLFRQPGRKKRVQGSSGGKRLECFVRGGSASWNTYFHDKNEFKKWGEDITTLSRWEGVKNKWQKWWETTGVLCGEDMLLLKLSPVWNIKTNLSSPTIFCSWGLFGWGFSRAVLIVSYGAETHVQNHKTLLNLQWSVYESSEVTHTGTASEIFMKFDGLRYDRGRQWEKRKGKMK